MENARDSHIGQRSDYLFSCFLLYDLIPTFLYCFEVLQMAAQQSKQEKQESNRTKWVALQRSAQLTAIVSKLRGNVLQVAQAELEQGDPDEVLYRWAIRFTQRNKGVTPHFEQHVRCALATGETARQVTDILLLDAKYMLKPELTSVFGQSMPQLRWVQTQREGLGLESYLYSFMRIAGASRVLQWGFDKTMAHQS
jgi:hypothetical protein